MKLGNVATEMLASRFTFLLVSTALQGIVISCCAAQTGVSLQPFAQQVRQVETTLGYLGQPLSADDHEVIDQAVADADEVAAVVRLEQTLDKYTLAIVEINPESRVKVQPGAAKPELVEAGTRIFLVKVVKKAGAATRVGARRPEVQPIFVRPSLIAIH